MSGQARGATQTPRLKKNLTLFVWNKERPTRAIVVWNFVGTDGNENRIVEEEELCGGERSTCLDAKRRVPTTYVTTKSAATTRVN